MNKIKLFYFVKPLVPRMLQIALRRKYVSIQIQKHKDVWPILESAGNTPTDWKGWHNSKKFAVVLTHDVETPKGHDKCKNLLNLEKEFGFRSSFNFVPERYNVSKNLRDFIVKNGFEVGVHGLTHDGKLFKDKQTFDERAIKINSYIKEWNATGFRAPAMHHNLEWINQLNIEYDLSTFDTDPFEPQSDGIGTIFPFLYSDVNNTSSYVEMPYTLVQDFTLFILMKQKNIDIWKDKVDWIASKGGMVLVNVHPDYINFDNGKSKFDEFSFKNYSNLLEYLKVKYNEQFWNPLPKEVAEFIKGGISKPHFEVTA